MIANRLMVFLLIYMIAALPLAIGQISGLYFILMIVSFRYMKKNSINLYPYERYFFISLNAFFIWSLFVALYFTFKNGYANQMADQYLTRYFILLYCIPVFYYLCERYRNYEKVFALIIIVSVLSFSLPYLYERFVENIRRPYLADNPNSIAFYTSFFLIFLISAQHKIKSFLKRYTKIYTNIAYYCLILPALLTIIIADSRTMLLALLVPVMFYLYKFTTLKRFSAVKMILSGVVVLGVLVLLLANTSRFVIIEDRLTSYQQGDYMTSIGQRLKQWEIAYDAFQRSPIIGSGIGAYFEDIKKQIEAGELNEQFMKFSIGAHSVFLTTASNSGIIGLSILLMMFVSPLLHFIHIYRRNRSVYAETGILFVIIMAIYGSMNVLLQSNRTVAFIGFMLVSLFVLIRSEVNEQG